MRDSLMTGASHVLLGEPNLSTMERAVSIMAGLALAAIGAQPRPNKLLSAVAIIAGAALAIRGATGSSSGEPDQA